MKALLLLLVPAAALPLVATPVQEDDMAKMMQEMAKYTTPGEEHELLGRFVGEWEGSSQVFFGAQAMDPAEGKASFRWKVPGRWIEGSWDGSVMGMPLSQHSWMGYDRFKQSYVWTGISSLDTAMNHAEGDVTPDGKSLILYGTLDEYLTGEHDKMVKYAWRFVSDDEIVLEVHDLPIGETNTKVLEFRYTRAK